MKLIFSKGKIVQKDADIKQVIDDLRESRDLIGSYSSDDLIEFFDKAAESWTKDKELLKIFGGGLKHLADFIKKDNTVRMLDFALRGNHKVLDGFVDFNQPGYTYMCQPRGLVVHWLAGNVPLLGFYSIIQAALTKNVSLVKASNRAYEDLVKLLGSLNSIETKISGKKLLQTICVVLVDRDDKKTQTIMSEAADVRIAWGGPEAIEAITSLKKSIFCDDIIYGPKYSYGIVDKAADQAKVAKRLAFDICTFDQYACSSPHTIFVQGNSIAFAENLAKQLDFVTKKFLPKEDRDAQKNLDILTQRAKYSMTGKVFSSKNTDWTVIHTDEEGLADACFSRVVFIKPIKDFKELSSYSTRKIQTLGVAISGEREKIISKLTRNGIDRCPKYGEMTLFESPWDGFFAIDRLVRWVGLCKDD
ncbi:MAG: hypothetical protein KKG59_05105 [Nanoarchaeota archaeon]|nr:hypothetical protein [Nanoarchaeota archaeon]